MRRSLARLSIPFKRPYATASGVVAERELALLRLEDEDGAVGYGEAAPFESYDGVALDVVVDALSDGKPGADAPVQARAAWELALLDLEARRAGRPVGEPGAERIAVNRTLPAGPPDEVARAAAQGVRDGFSCFKLKVGLPDDAERVAAVREATRAVARAARGRERRVERRAGRDRARAAAALRHPARRAAVRNAAPSSRSCGAIARCR